MIDPPAASGGSRPVPVQVQVNARVVENVPIADRTFRVRLEAPEIARSIQPGQFVMVRPATGLDPLFGRPFALYEVVGDAIDLVYLVVGRGTACLSERRPGDLVAAWGPLGRPFGPPPTGDVVFIAGGIGQTPFLSLGRWWLGRGDYGGQTWSNPARSVRMTYGVRTAALAAGLDDFALAEIPVDLATDDGSAGSRGNAVDLARSRLDRGEIPEPAKLVACGPSPMLAAVARLAESRGIDSDLALENSMACGFGACFSCVVPIRQADGSTDLRRSCVEGPVFPGRDVVFG